MSPPNADRTTTRAIVVFVAIAYALSIALSLVVGWTGGYRSRFAGLGVIAMFFPTVAVLVVRFAMQEKVPSLIWQRFPLQYLPVALLLIPVVMHAVMLPLAATLWDTLPWESWLAPEADGLYHAPASRGWGVLTTQGLVGRVALNAGIGVIVNSILALFEEIGWRAWMLPRLVNRMGARRAVIMSALIWAFWHTPFALSGIHHLDGVPIALTALTMPIAITGAGVVIGWLWLRTESIWIVALAHGALNNWGQYAFKFMNGPGQPGDVVILGAAGVALLAVGSLLLALPSASPKTATSRSEQPLITFE